MNFIFVFLFRSNCFVEQGRIFLASIKTNSLLSGASHVHIIDDKLEDRGKLVGILGETRIIHIKDLVVLSVVIGDQNPMRSIANIHNDRMARIDEGVKLIDSNRVDITFEVNPKGSNRVPNEEIIVDVTIVSVKIIVERFGSSESIVKLDSIRSKGHADRAHGATRRADRVDGTISERDRTPGAVALLV